MDPLPPLTVMLGVLGTLVTTCTWLGLRRWADRTDSARALLMIAVILWMPDVWMRWVQQTAEERTQEILDYASTLYMPTATTTTTIPK